MLKNVFIYSFVNVQNIGILKLIFISPLMYCMFVCIGMHAYGCVCVYVCVTYSLAMKTLADWYPKYVCQRNICKLSVHT